MNEKNPNSDLINDLLAAEDQPLQPAPDQPPPPETPPPPREIPKALLTVTGCVYHQVTEGGPSTQVGHPWEKRLKSEDQPYQRWLDVTPDARLIDKGWLEGVEYVHIQCNKGSVGVGVPDFYLILEEGEATGFRPSVIPPIWSCSHENAKVVLTLIPS